MWMSLSPLLKAETTPSAAALVPASMMPAGNSLYRPTAAPALRQRSETRTASPTGAWHTLTKPDKAVEGLIELA